jgi:hypothetical protein
VNGANLPIPNRTALHVSRLLPDPYRPADAVAAGARHRGEHIVLFAPAQHADQRHDEGLLIIDKAVFGDDDLHAAWFEPVPQPGNEKSVVRPAAGGQETGRGDV